MGIIKPITKTEKVDFLIKKIGLFDTLPMVYFTDEQFDNYFDKHYESLKSKKDFAEDMKILKSNKLENLKKRKKDIEYIDDYKYSDNSVYY